MREEQEAIFIILTSFGGVGFIMSIMWFIVEYPTFRKKQIEREKYIGRTVTYKQSYGDKKKLSGQIVDIVFWYGNSIDKFIVLDSGGVERHVEKYNFVKISSKESKKVKKEGFRMPKFFKITAYIMLLSLMYKFVSNIESIIAYFF